MASSTTPYRPRSYRRVCDVCGNLRQIEEMHKQDTLWVCTYDAGERVRTELDRGNARQRPFTIRPVPHPKPWDNYYPNLLETDDAAVFNFLTQQVSAQCRFERVESGHGVYTSAGGALPALSWAARYFYDLIQENDPSRALLIPRAKVLLQTIADFLLTRQRGALTGFFPTSTQASDAFYGGFLASGATVYITDDTSTSGLALLYAYRILGTRSYLDGARAAASYLRNVQAIGSNGSQHTSTDAAGTGRLYTGAVCSQVSTTFGIDPGQNFYSNHLFYPGGLIALEFWNELKTTDGDRSIGATTAVNGFDTTPAQLLSRSITDMRTCWETGITDSTGTLINGFSATTPKEFFNAYPLAKSGFTVFGTGRWEYADGNAASGTQITAQNFSQAISSLYNYEGATSQVTGISDWLRTFTSNPDFETPANTSTSVLYQGTTGTYNPVDSLATLLTVVGATENGSSLYDWGAFGLMSRLWASRNKGSFRQSRLFPLNTVQRFYNGNDTDGLSTDRVILRGLSGLSMQTGFSSDTLNPGATAAYAGGPGAAAATSPPRTGLVQWVKGDAGITLVSGRVSAWADQSGSGQNFVQGTAGERPYMLGDTINGIPALSFGVAGDANKHMGTAGNFVNRSNVAMTGSSARTVMVVSKPRFDAAFGRTGGTVWSQGTWFALFELRSDLVANGAYAWMRAAGDYGNALQFTPIPGGASGPFDGTVIVTQHASPAFPSLGFSVTSREMTLAPSVMYGTPTTLPAGAQLSELAIGYLGSISEVLVWDYDLTTDPTAQAQAISYLAGRYSSLTLVNLAMTNDAVRAAQFGRSFRESRA